MNPFIHWLILNKALFQTKSQTQIADLAIAAGFNRTHVALWQASMPYQQEAA